MRGFVVEVRRPRFVDRERYDAVCVARHDSIPIPDSPSSRARRERARARYASHGCRAPTEVDRRRDAARRGAARLRVSRRFPTTSRDVAHRRHGAHGAACTSRRVTCLLERNFPLPLPLSRTIDIFIVDLLTSRDTFSRDGGGRGREGTGISINEGGRCPVD